MKEPAFIQPIIPGVVIKVVPLKIPLTKLNHVGKAPVELQVLEIHPLVDVLYGRVAHPEVIRRVLDQPRRVDTRAVVGGDHLGGVGLALLEDVVKGVLELGDLEEGEVRDALEAVARIREIAVCQHPGHNAMPDVDS